MRLSFVIPSRPGTDLTAIKAQIRRLDLDGHSAEFFFVEGTLPPLQRNVAIRRTTGEFVFLLDDDLIVPLDLVPRTLARFDGARVAVVGGPNVTPAGDPPFAQLSGEILASPLATGATSPRWREGPPDYDATEQKLHGCFLCFRGDLLRQYLFVEDLFPNDENELMWRLRRDGYRLYYIPQCSVQHKRRATLRSHLKQVYISGRGRGELMRRSGLTGQLLYLGPAALLAWLVMTPFVFRRFPIAVVPLIAYAVLALALSGVTFARRQQPIFLLAGPLMLLSHLVYGAGLLKGLAASRAYEGKALSMEVVEFSAREDVGDRRDRDLVGRDVQLERADDLIVRQEIG